MMTFDSVMVLPGGTNAPSLEAIALGLARRPRFAGQTSRPFNVLAHSFLVADLIDDPAVKAHGLLHDAAEAIVGDIPSPWKTEVDREREGNIMHRIYYSIGMVWPQIFSDDPPMLINKIVAAADHLALQAEATLLMPPAIASCGTGEIPRLKACHPAMDRAAYWIDQCAAKSDEFSYWQKRWCNLVRAAVQKL